MPGDYGNKVICPYCGHDHTDLTEFQQEATYYCDACDKAFFVGRLVTVKYSVSPAEPVAPVMRKITTGPPTFLTEQADLDLLAQRILTFLGSGIAAEGTGVGAIRARMGVKRAVAMRALDTLLLAHLVAFNTHVGYRVTELGRRHLGQPPYEGTTIAGS